MIIRLATRDDALRIATIHVTAWKAAYQGIVLDELLRLLSIEKRHSVWIEILEAENSLTWIAEEGDTALGWVSAAGSRDSDATPSTGEIWAIYIDPGNWGKGVGRALCDAAEQELRRRGFAEMTLWVLKENERALRFYQTNGFVRDDCAERSVGRGAKELRELRLRKRILPATPHLDQPNR